MFPEPIETLAAQIVNAYAARKMKIVTAESCTGGLIAAALTSIAGSSAVVERGFVSYSNDAKVELLGVEPELIQIAGAVSADVAEQMAQGALEFSLADVALSVTGIAGPGGGSTLKPVGLVFFGLANRSGTLMHYRCQFNGDRNTVRVQAVEEGLKLLYSLLDA